MTRQHFLRRAAAWAAVICGLAWLQTSSGTAAYDRLLQAMDAASVKQARADSLAAVAQARREATRQGDSVAAVVVSPPLSGRDAHTQRAELWWLAALGIPAALLGLGLNLARFRRAGRDSAR